MGDALVSERPLPLVEAPVALASPRVARLLVSVWDRAVAPALRASAEPVPDELADFVAACRRVSAVGSGVDVGPSAAAGSTDGEITTAQAAARLGCTQRRVRQLVGEGRLRARKVGAAWLVEASEVEDHCAGRAAAG